MEEARSRFLSIWSNPNDLRPLKEVAEDLGVPVSVLMTWQSDPALCDTASRRFKEALPGAFITINKSLLVAALERRSTTAARTILEQLGALRTGTGSVNVFVGGNGGSQDLKKMSDDELDRVIHQLVMDAYPPDVALVEGRAKAVSDILEAEFTPVKRVPDESGPDGLESPVEEGETSLSPVGENP
jgi:hypothetical protein